MTATTTTTTIRGSYGTIKADTRTGCILSYDPAGNEPEYADILYFDPATLTEADMDILGTSFVSASGWYTPLLPWGCVDEVEGWHEWIDVAGYLPHYA